MKKRFLAFTLTEVIVAMLVIAVVVAVSIRVTKNKLNSILSLTYYSTYSTIKSITEEILIGFRSDDDDYVLTHKPLFISPAFAGKISDYFGTSSADNKYGCAEYTYYDLKNGKLISESCGPSGLHSVTEIDSSGCKSCSTRNKLLNNEYRKCDSVYASSSKGELGIPTFTKSSACTSTTEQIFKNIDNKYGDNIVFRSYSGSSTYSYGEYATGIGGGMTTANNDYYCENINDYQANIFFIGNRPDQVVCAYYPKSEDEGSTCDGEQPCGKICDNSTGNWVDDPNFSDTCTNSNEVFDNTACQCVITPTTLPRKAENFCKLFANYSNTKQEACEGSNIADNTTEFSDKIPDIVLRNGVKLYNLSKTPPRKFAILAGNKNTGHYEGVDNINEYGYLIYADIDGSNSDGILWEDVYPFYITLSGKVLPAYNTAAGAEETGGASKLHLQVSVKNLLADGPASWVKKNVSFKEGACASGYVSTVTPYCSNSPGYSLDSRCSGENADCRIKLIMPVRFW